MTRRWYGTADSKSVPSGWTWTSDFRLERLAAPLVPGLSGLQVGEFRRKDMQADHVAEIMIARYLVSVFEVAENEFGVIEQGGVGPLPKRVIQLFAVQHEA